MISPRLAEPFSVDSTPHDTTSVLATIEQKFHLAPLTTRDATVASLASAFARGGDDQGDDRDGWGGGQAAAGDSDGQAALGATGGLLLPGGSAMGMAVVGLALVAAGAARAVTRRRRSG